MPSITDLLAAARPSAQNASRRLSKQDFLEWPVFNGWLQETLGDLYEDQGGPQQAFWNAQADIVIYGGAAGGGKTFALLIEALRWIGNPGFGAVVFRRTLKQVKDEGGLWDNADDLYPLAGAKSNLAEYFWKFPSGATLQFAGLEHEKSKHNWQGSQICLLGFDELGHFTESQFWYLISRNRSICGVKPYVRGTLNPTPGWPKRLLAPWVDKGFPNPARPGEVRWFVREKGQIIWLDEKPDRVPCKLGEDRAGCKKARCENCFPPEKSITFIPATVYDNPALLDKNPGYVGNLLAQDEAEKRRLHDGDWDVKLEHLVIDAFDEGRHKVASRDLPANWKMRSVGMDFGGVNTAEVIVVEDPANKNLYVVAEDWPGHSRSWDAIADQVREMCGGTPIKGGGGNVTTEQGWRQAFRAKGIPMEEPISAHRDPGLQYQNINALFRNDELFVWDSCPKLLAMLATFQRDVDDDGVVLDTFKDTKFHLLAALRGIITLLRPPRPPKTALDIW